MSDGRFTAEQHAAIERRTGSFALTANAGSGKTSVLVERYVRAVLRDGVAPARILAITFTDRAAGELRERVRAQLVAAGARAAARESAGAFVSTFHGFCARVLRTHALLAGCAPDFGVLGDAQAATLRDAAFERALESWLAEPGALDLAAAFDVTALREAIGDAYDELRSRGERVPVLPPAAPRHDLAAARARLARAAAALGPPLASGPGEAQRERALAALERCVELTGPGAQPPPRAVREIALPRGSAAARAPAGEEYEVARLEFEQACADRLGVPAVAAVGRLLVAFGEAYAMYKRGRGALDFDDLELEAGALLATHEEVRAQWAERFELVMVDELQDTNARQMALLDALARENLFTVGDEFQSIYGFRHADVALFRARHVSLAAVGAAGVLSANFRSRPPLLAAVNAAFASRFGEGFVPLVAGRETESSPVGDAALELLLTDADGWEAHEERLGVELAPAPLWRRAEARLLARRIDQLLTAGAARAEDIAVLFRAGGAIGAYETALADLGHATLASAGGGFFARPEIVDLVAYVQALANPRDELALYSVLASPLCGCSADSLAELALGTREGGVAAWEALTAAPPDARSAAFVERFLHDRAAVAHRSLAEIVSGALARHGYDVHLATLHAPERRLANVHKLEQLAREFEAREGRDLRGFARALAAGRVGSMHETEAPPPVAGTGAIRLMTIHAAKGLEFPVVCLADLAHAPFRGESALLVDGDRVGLRLPTAERERVDTLAYEELRDARARAAAAEEQRIIYVAMTRARERLILSGAARFAAWPRELACPIAWLGPAVLPDLAARAATGDAVETLRGAGEVPLRVTLSTPGRIDELLGPAPATQPSATPQGPHVAATHETVGADATEPTAAPALPTLSYTAITDYERCGYRYHLQRVAGLADVEAPAAAGWGSRRGDAAARGIVIHALLAELDFARPGVPAAGDVAAAALHAGVELGADGDAAELAELASAFARSPLCARLAAAREVRHEEPFAFALGGEGELLRGFFDVAGVERDGTLLIVDYKSDRIVDGEDLGLRIEREYSLQRTVYALAGLAAGAPTVEVAHSFLRRPEALLATRFGAADRATLEALLAARLAPLRAGRFEVSAEPNRERCGTCPGRARLCSHDETMTLRSAS